MRFSHSSSPPRQPAFLITVILLYFSGWPGVSLGAESTLTRCKPPQLFRGGSHDSAVTPEAGPLRVMSLNMHGMIDWEVVHAELKTRTEFVDVDIFLLQEVKEAGRKLVEAASAAMDYHYVFASNQNLGLAILSRFALSGEQAQRLPYNNLRHNSRCRIALSAVARTGLGPLNLFNVHLDTRINASRRVRQVRTIMEAAERADGPSLIAGDFNTANLLWIQSIVPIPFLQWHKGAVKKAMKKAGFTTPFESTGATFGFPPLKLDWIYLRGVRSRARGLVPLNFSDHRVLWVILE